MEKMHERIELQQNQIGKMQRDKENVLSELDLVKDRWEKAHNTHQKLTVRKFNFSLQSLLGHNTLDYSKIVLTHNRILRLVYYFIQKIEIEISSLMFSICFSRYCDGAA